MGRTRGTHSRVFLPTASEWWGKVTCFQSGQKSRWKGEKYPFSLGWGGFPSQVHWTRGVGGSSLLYSTALWLGGYPKSGPDRGYPGQVRDGGGWTTCSILDWGVTPTKSNWGWPHGTPIKVQMGGYLNGDLPPVGWGTPMPWSRVPGVPIFDEFYLLFPL